MENPFIRCLVLFLISVQIEPNQSFMRSRVAHSAEVSSLQLAQVVFRHGDRTPFGNTYPNDPYNDVEKYWPQGWGQLTKKGKLMEYELGEFLKWRYSGFLTKAYSRTEVYARSSDTDRTINSAELVLAGMYPPEGDAVWNPNINWQPIPVRTIPAFADRLIRFGMPCPRYTQLFEALQNSEIVRDINDANQDLYKFLSEHTGSDIKDYRMVADLYDTFFIENLYYLPLPDWVMEVFPKRMKPLAILEFEMVAYTNEMKKLIGGSLLMDLIQNMERTINPPKPPLRNINPAKAMLYSGHDTTVAAILSVLGVYDKSHIPPYAAAVMIELHKGLFGENERREEHFVRIFYKNESESSKPPMELQIPGCVMEDTEQEGVCKFADFKNLMRNFVITDWNEECDVQSALPQLNIFNQLSLATGVFFALLALLGIVVSLITILFTFMAIRNWQRRRMRQKILERMFTVSSNSGFEGSVNNCDAVP